MRPADDTLRRARDQEAGRFTMRASFLLGPLAVFALVASLGCGGGTSPQGTACNPCDTPPASGGSGQGSSGSGQDGAATAHRDVNLTPDGVAYPSPTGGYGRSARRGNTAGSVIQNFKFLGYPNADASHGL